MKSDAVCVSLQQLALLNSAQGLVFSPVDIRSQVWFGYRHPSKVLLQLSCLVCRYRRLNILPLKSQTCTIQPLLLALLALLMTPSKIADTLQCESFEISQHPKVAEAFRINMDMTGRAGTLAVTNFVNTRRNLLP
eukprot:scaffold101913_cov16-Tisochrysis_lutea.AAC.1